MSSFLWLLKSFLDTDSDLSEKETSITTDNDMFDTIFGLES